MNFNDETKFKPLAKFSGFTKSTSPKDLTYYEASEGYYVSCEGEIWSTKARNPRKLGGLNAGYLGCEIILKNGKSKGISVHRLVATCWCEGFNPEAGRILVNHIDENKQNNHPSNLEWCTNSHNINHGTGLERASQTMKELWKNQGYRDKVTRSSVKEQRHNPEYKEKMSQSAKERWKSPEYREKMKELNDNPEHKAKMSQAYKDMWKNPEHREKVKESYNNPEYKSKLSQSAKERWKNPEYREKMSKTMKELYDTPEHKEKMSRAFSRPVALFRPDGTVYKVFASVREAQHYEQVSESTIIIWLQKRKPSKCGRYYWDYCK